MRPRVFPAEHLVARLNPFGVIRRFNEAAGIPRGTRERRRESGARPSRFNEAAGIPRGTLGDLRGVERIDRASMRPRVFPAEHDGAHGGRGRGRRASMRPRVFPAEHLMCSAWRPSGTTGFNEAAGIPRGTLGATGAAITSTATGFNEAAGIPRGTRSASRTLTFRSAWASMRPRVFPAEHAARREP